MVAPRAAERYKKAWRTAYSLGHLAPEVPYTRDQLYFFATQADANLIGTRKAFLSTIRPTTTTAHRMKKAYEKFLRVAEECGPDDTVLYKFSAEKLESNEKVEEKPDHDECSNFELPQLYLQPVLNSVSYFQLDLNGYYGLVDAEKSLYEDPIQYELKYETLQSPWVQKYIVAAVEGGGYDIRVASQEEIDFMLATLKPNLEIPVII